MEGSYARPAGTPAKPVPMLLDHLPAGPAASSSTAGGGGSGGGTSSVQETIAQNAQETLARYPIAAGLLRGDIAPSLPSLPPFPPSAFSPSTPSTGFNLAQVGGGDYTAGLALLDRHGLGYGSVGPAPGGQPVGTPEERQWVERQMALANAVMAKEIMTSDLSSLRFVDPPYGVPAGTPAPGASGAFSSPPPASKTPASRHANALKIPYPTPTSSHASSGPLASTSRKHVRDASAASFSSASNAELFQSGLESALRTAADEAARKALERSVSPTRMTFVPVSPSKSPTGAKPFTIPRDSPATTEESAPSSAVNTPLKPFSAPFGVGSPFSPDPLALGGASSSKSYYAQTELDPIRPQKLDFSSSLSSVPSSSQTPQPQAKKRKAEGQVKVVIPPSPLGKIGKVTLKLGAGVGKGKGRDDSSAAGALNRLQSFIEDLLEADDMLSPDYDPFSASPNRTPGGSLSVPFFLPAPLPSASASRSHIFNPAAAQKLVKLVEAAKKHSPAAVAAGGKEVLCEVETTDLARVVKVLERTIKSAEEVDVVPLDVVNKSKRRLRRDDFDDARPTKSAKGGKNKGKGKTGKTSKATSLSPVMSRKASRRGSTAEGDEEAEEYLPGTHSKAGSLAPPSAKKMSRGRSGSRSPVVRSPSAMDEDAHSDDEDADLVNDDLVEKVVAGLQVLEAGIRAAEAVTALWTGARLPKQLYVEEAITTMTGTVKAHLAGTVYPFLEADADSMDGYSSLLGSLLTYGNVVEAMRAATLAFAALLPRLAALVTQEDMSEPVLIHAGYVAIGPFFVEPVGPAGGGRKKEEGWAAGGLRGLRMGALDLLRAIVARSPDQRDWIVEEVLTSLTKMSDLRLSKASYLLPNGKHLHTISALLLHLVQTCTYGVRKAVRKSLRTQRAAVVAEGNSLSDLSREEEATTTAVQELVEPAIASATRMGKKIILFLLQKSGKGSKNTNEADYKVVFEHLLADMLTVLFSPDWPVAEFLLHICCRTMATVLEDPKISAEVNAAKSLCLEHLGPILARLSKPLTAQSDDVGAKPPARLPLIKVIAQADVETVDRVCASQRWVIDYLTTVFAAEEMGTSAADLLSAQWVMEISQGRRSIGSLQASYVEEGGAVADEAYQKREDIARILREQEGRIWERAQSTLKISSEAPPTEREVTDMLEIVSSTEGLRSSMDVFLDRVVAASASSSVTFRSKAIRSIGLIVAADPGMFFNDLVRRAIENRLLDSSPAVRDAAIELVGKYVGSRPELAVTYYPHISARITDKGLNVRKRVVKLLRQIYATLDESTESIRIDICRRLISRVYDEDDSIKDLAMDSIEELWFSKASDTMDTRTKGAIIMSVVAPLKERPSPMEETLKHIHKKHEQSKTLSALHKRCEDIANSLIDDWMDGSAAERDPTFNELDCIKTIYVVTSLNPGMLSPSKVALLLPFLKGAATAEEQALSEYLLKIFRACVTDMPRSAGVKFGTDLQTALLPLINKPNLGNGGSTLQELVACFCAAVIHQTHGFARLVNVFKACEARLRSEIRKLRDKAKAVTVNVKALPVLMYLVSSFVEHGQLDTIRKEQAVAADLNAITRGPLSDHVYDLLVEAYQLIPVATVRGLTLACLGFIFRAFPTLMTEPPTTAIMDDIFAGNNVEMEARMLRIMSEFLTSQSLKTADDNEEGEVEGVDMNLLIGNNEGFANSGVALAVVQRYMANVTKAALSPLAQLHKPAVDIIGFTIRQGLAHPIACLPVLVSLESSTDTAMATKAYALHHILHNKRPELVHTRFFETTRAVFDHQSQAGDAGVRGHRGSPPKSILAPWYTLVSQRRNWRLDFVKSLAKAFAVDPAGSSTTQDDVDFARFLAEALAMLEYKTQEELFVIISALNKILAMYAYTALHLVEGKTGIDLLDSGGIADRDDHTITPEAARNSVVLGMAFLLRDHLKGLFGISDAKCAKHAAAAGKKSRGGDTAASRRPEVDPVLQYDTMPAARFKMVSQQDFKAQAAAFANLVENDSTLLAEDEAEEDEEGDNVQSS